MVTPKIERWSDLPITGQRKPAHRALQQQSCGGNNSLLYPSVEKNISFREHSSTDANRLHIPITSGTKNDVATNEGVLNLEEFCPRFKAWNR